MSALCASLRIDVEAREKAVSRTVPRGSTAETTTSVLTNDSTADAGISLCGKIPVIGGSLEGASESGRRVVEAGRVGSTASFDDQDRCVELAEATGDGETSRTTRRRFSCRG